MRKIGLAPGNFPRVPTKGQMHDLPASNEGAPSVDALENESSPSRDGFRRASVYDVVAGRLGDNGFLSKQQYRSRTFVPSGPEEYLLRRTTIPAEMVEESYSTVEGPSRGGRLPEAECLKAVHAYASDFYHLNNRDKSHSVDTRSLDETALIAVGILMEEAVREALGENGDMVFVEPEGLENGLLEDAMTKHQVKGKVKTTPTPREALSETDSLETEASPAKRRRH